MQKRTMKSFPTQLCKIRNKRRHRERFPVLRAPYGEWLADFDPHLLPNNNNVLIYIYFLHSVSVSSATNKVISKMVDNVTDKPYLR